MIKVKIDRPAPNVFYVEDGYTVSYADDVLEVLNEDEETIAVFRDWLFAMPAEEEDLDPEEEELAPTLNLRGVETVEAELLDTSSYASLAASNHGNYAAPGDETEDQAL